MRNAIEITLLVIAFLSFLYMCLPDPEPELTQDDLDIVDALVAASNQTKESKK